MDYVCDSCGSTECKLWRQSHVFSNAVKLTCLECLESLGYCQGEWGDQFYDPEISPINYVPAVPDLDGSFWGYTSVPEWWVQWWKFLPDRKSDCTMCRGTKKIGKYECIRCEGSGKR